MSHPGAKCLAAAFLLLVGPGLVEAADAKEEEAVKVIEKHGGKVIRDPEGHAGGVYLLEGTREAEACFKQLKNLPRLIVLSVNEVEVPDSAFAQLKGLTGLMELGLYRTRITKSGLESLEGLKSLRGNILSHSGLTDADMESLKQISKLHSLSVVEPAVHGCRHQAPGKLDRP